jgi:hypothetical protein
VKCIVWCLTTGGIWRMSVNCQPSYHKAPRGIKAFNGRSSRVNYIASTTKSDERNGSIIHHTAPSTHLRWTSSISSKSFIWLPYNESDSSWSLLFLHRPRMVGSPFLLSTCICTSCRDSVGIFFGNYYYYHNNNTL